MTPPPKQSFRRDWQPIPRKGEPDPPARGDPLARLAAWSTFANTVVTALIGIAAAYVAYQAYLATQGQFAEARIANRPWITVEAKLPQGTLNSVGRYGEPVANQTYYQLDFLFTLRNIGHSPARGVYVAGSGHFPVSQDRERLKSELAAEQRRICDTGRGFSNEFVTLFPEQTRDQRASLNKTSEDWEMATREGESTVTLVFIGCVGYQDGYGDAHHTFFAFDLLEAPPKGKDEFYHLSTKPWNVKKIILGLRREAELLGAD